MFLRLKYVEQKCSPDLVSKAEGKWVGQSSSLSNDIWLPDSSKLVKYWLEKEIFWKAKLKYFQMF